MQDIGTATCARRTHLLTGILLPQSATSLSIHKMRLILTRDSDKAGWVPRLRTSRENTRYAILSHRWFDDPNSEVLFADLSEIDESAIGPVKNSQYAGSDPSVKAGFAKVQGAALQALNDGYEYIWVDTCCIDKNSSAELSEAINSMFNWYRNSGICYVYLADCAYYDSVTETGRISFLTSKWWTRGWTLQELLAPSDLIFFTLAWTEIGRKDSPYLAPFISEVSGIEINVLNGTIPLKFVSIAQRMSWAAKRITSRTEDIAYSLIGIFAVNMPLLYGEGERAFLRLQYEIMKDSDDETIFAWKEEVVASNRSPKNAHVFHGLLAAHPSAFSESYNIVQLHSDEAVLPHNMTNSGLAISFPLQNNGESSYIAWLRCVSLDFEEKIGIHLVKTTPGGFQYARVRSNEWFCDMTQGQSEYTSIHVKKHHDQVPAYKELNSDRKEIRLIQVLPSEDSSPMKLRLINANFEHAIYKALSYVWDRSNQTQIVLLNSERVCIPEKMYDYLCNAQKQSLYWIDIICIPLYNPLERNHHVFLMAQIYKHAAQVDVLLDGVCPIVDNYFQHSWSCPDPKSLLEEATVFADIAKHRYWERIWVLQEFVVARDIILQLDTCSLSISCFNRMYTSAQSRSDTGLDGVKIFLDYRNSMRQARLRKRTSIGPTSEPSTCGRLQASFEEMLYTTRHLRCTDPRDRVYTITNICNLDRDFSIDGLESTEDLIHRVVAMRGDRLKPGTLLLLQRLLLNSSPEGSETDALGHRLQIEASAREG